MGTADRLIRILIAVLIAGLYGFNVIGGTLAIVLMIVSGVFILTSFISYCPLYSLFTISTRKKENS